MINLFSIRLFLRSYIGKNPTFFFMLQKIIGKKNKIFAVNKSTDIVIEGFPRSANTFAIYAFDFVQQKRHNIAHHLHVPAQIIKGVRLKIPIIVLIRDPIDSVISLLIREPKLDLRIALRIYIMFYKTVFKYLNSAVIASFSDVTHNMGDIILEINNRFNKNFNLYRNSQELDSKIFDLIREGDRKLGYDSIYETALPTEARKLKKNEVRKELNKKIHSKLIHRSKHIYKTIVKLPN